MPHTINDALEKKISPPGDDEVVDKIDIRTLLDQCLTCMANKFKLNSELKSESECEKNTKDENKIADSTDHSNGKSTKILNAVKNIIETFVNFWNLNTQDPGCSLVVLHYVRSRTEEDVLGIKMRIGMRMERREDEEGVSGEQGGEGECAGCVGVVDSLLRASAMIPFSLHPRQLLIIAWLLESTHAEHSSISSYEINHEERSKNSEIQSTEYSRTIAAITARGSSVLTLFQAVHSIDRNTINKGNKVMSNIMHWLDVRLDKVMSIEYGDQITAELLDIKSVKLCSLLLQVCGM